jgi:dTDP-4-amino-4,6-dideoxygalactose transaminase
MANVPFLDVGATYRELKPEIDEAIHRVLAGGQYIAGQEVETFEAEFASYVGAGYCVGVGNGLDALFLALVAHGIKPGDEVIVPSHTFIATWLAVSRTGATPIAVDTEKQGFNLDLGQVEAAITPRTRAIIPVHLYGIPVALNEIERIINGREIMIIDDAAQACGSSLGDHRIGSANLPAQCTAWSFYPGKNLGAFGDGGAVTTNDLQIAEKLRMLRNYGSRVKYHHELAGVNSRLDPIQAAILNVKLPHLENWNERRQVIAAIYQKELSPHLGIWQHPSGVRSNWHLFVVESRDRRNLVEWLSSKSIEIGIHYPIAPHRQDVYQSKSCTTALSRTEDLCEMVLSLPIGPHLSEVDAHYVSSQIHELYSVDE